MKEKKSIQISGILHEHLRIEAAKRGYSCVDEFAAHVLEQVIGEQEDISDEALDERLKGLGYLG